MYKSLFIQNDLQKGVRLTRYNNLVKFGGEIPAGKFWWQDFGGKTLVGKFWREDFGKNFFTPQKKGHSSKLTEWLSREEKPLFCLVTEAKRRVKLYTKTWFLTYARQLLIARRKC